MEFERKSERAQAGLFAPLFLVIAVTICLVSFSSPSQAEPPLHILLGVAAPSPGLGIFGHIFAVVDHTELSMMDATVYSYAAEIKKKSALNAAKLVGGVLPLEVEKFTFNQFELFDTRVRNQTLILYDLNVTPQEAEKVAARFEQDTNDPLFGKKYKYDITRENCVFYVIDLINQTVTPDRRIPIRYLPSPFSFKTYGSFFSPREVMAQFPFDLMTSLAKMKIVRGKPEVYVPEKITTQASYLDLERTLPVIAERCHWSSAVAKIAFENIELSSRNGVRYPLFPLMNLATQTCPHQTKDILPLLFIAYRLAKVQDGLTRGALNDAMDKITE